jgi:hypothetical protein
MLAIVRPLRAKRRPRGIEELCDFFERPDLFAGAGVGQIKMEIVIAKFAAAVGGDGKLSIG